MAERPGRGGGGRRGLRRKVLRRLEGTFDLARLDWRRRVPPRRQEAVLLGVGTAMLLYGLGFGLAWGAFRGGAIDEELLTRVSWLLIFPSSVVGVLTYLIGANRREYRVARDVLEHMVEVEGREGLLWRYGPLVEALGLEDETARQVLKASREGDIARVEPEDYANLVHRLHRALREEGASLDPEAVRAWEALLRQGRTREGAEGG